MASQSTPEPDDKRFQNHVRRRVVGSSEADIIAAVRGDHCLVDDQDSVARPPELRDAREERVMTMVMKMEDTAPPSLLGRVRHVYEQLGLLPLSVIQLMARFSLAVIFWRSGQAKIANWDLTLQLFANEYKVPILPPEIAAPMAAAVELSTPILLVLGLFTRVATLPMIGMTLVIQIFVYPMSWADHLVWMTLLLLLLSRGPGVVSLDHLAKKTLDRHM
jgi:putative oxidoreductase